MTDPSGDHLAPTEAEASVRRGLIGGVIGRVAPAVIRQVDMDAIIAELDVDAIAAQLDLDALIERLDVNAIANRLDLDALMARLDFDEIVERLDVDAIANRLDLDALMARLDMAQLTAGVTQDVAASGLDLFRRQLVRLDRTVEGVVDRILRGEADSRPAAPPALASPDPDPGQGPDAEPGPPRRRTVSGHYAGPVTRSLALTGDVAVAVSSFGFFGAATLYLISTFTGLDLSIGSGGWLNAVLFGAWMLFWFWVPVALFSRTLFMAVLGIAVVRRDGEVASSSRAFVRALVLPFSLVILLIGLLGMFVGKERRTLHDVAAGTVVVYDWGAREAEQPATIREQLSARVTRRRAATPATPGVDPA